MGANGEAIEIADPFRIDAAGDVAGEGGVGITVGADNGAGAHKGQDVALGAVGKIGGMDEAEGGGSEHLLFLAAAGGFVDDRRGVPFAERDGEAARSQPAAEKESCVLFPEPSMPSTTISLPR